MTLEISRRLKKFFDFLGYREFNNKSFVFYRFVKECMLATSLKIISYLGRRSNSRSLIKVKKTIVISFNFRGL